MVNFGSVEMQMLAWAVGLGIVHLLLVTLFSVGTRGLPWGLSSRDAPDPPLGSWAARLERSFKNFLETFGFFLGAVVIAQTLGKHTHQSALGAQLYFWCRVAFIPAYVFGIIGVRTALWIGSLVGIILVLSVACPVL